MSSIGGGQNAGGRLASTGACAPYDGPPLTVGGELNKLAVNTELGGHPLAFRRLRLDDGRRGSGHLHAAGRAR